MVAKLKLGLVGADAERKGWGAIAHVPALLNTDQIELSALCTSRPESAAAAGKAYGIDRVYYDVNELVSQPDIDIIAVVVRIPYHYAIVKAALKAGKHVYCEWPLGANLEETKELAKLANTKNLVTAIGLQGRRDPTINYIKELNEQGWFGEIHSINMTMYTRGNPERASRQAYESEVKKAAHLKNIVVGHTVDYLTYCFGPLEKVSAQVATRVNQFRMTDTGEIVDVDIPDNILFNGTLSSKALVSCQISAVPFHSEGWRLAVYGSEGTIIATSQILPQIAPITLVGSQGNEEMKEMIVPERLTMLPSSVPEGPPKNVARLYREMAEAILDGKTLHPNFDDALKMHQFVDAIQISSDEGRAVELSQ